jgi:hypothetical protein
LRIEPRGAPTLSPKVTASGAGADVRRVHPSRFDWAGHARPAVFAGSILMAAIAGILVLQRPATPTSSAIDPAERVTASAPRSAMADLPPASPLAVSTAASESPSVEAPVPSEVIPPVRGGLRDTPPSQATDTRPIASVPAPSASVAVSSTTPVPPPRAFALGDAPVGALAPRAETTAAVTASPSLSIPPTVPAPASDAATSTVSTDVSVSAAARPTGRDLDARAIENVLGQYRHAFNSLDAGAAVAVWPTVNERNLARAFEGLDDQDVSFESCTIEVGGVHAEAACTGTARYLLKVGSRTPRTEARRWRFILRRASDGWLIDRVDAR